MKLFSDVLDTIDVRVKHLAVAGVGDLIIVSRHLKPAGFPLFQDFIDSYIFAIRSQNCDGLEPNIRSPLLTARTQGREKKKKEDKKKDDAKHR